MVTEREGAYRPATACLSQLQGGKRRHYSVLVQRSKQQCSGWLGWATRNEGSRSWVPTDLRKQMWIVTVLLGRATDFILPEMEAGSQGWSEAPCWLPVFATPGGCLLSVVAPGLQFDVRHESRQKSGRGATSLRSKVFESHDAETRGRPGCVEVRERTGSG